MLIPAFNKDDVVSSSFTIKLLLGINKFPPACAERGKLIVNVCPDKVVSEEKSPEFVWSMREIELIDVRINLFL